MKKIFSILTVLLVMGWGSNAFAQISWSGDLQVRPRYDMKDYGKYGGVKNDMYYMMRARLNMKVNIGGGWFGHVQLGHYNYAGYYYTSGLAEQPGLAGDPIARPGVNFNLMYFGYHGKSFGIEGGIIPLNGIANPMYDIHYLPGKMIDIAFAIYRLNSATGFKGYIKAGPGKINYLATKDNNEYYATDVNGNVTKDLHDTYTFGVDYSFKAGGFSFQPAIYFTYASNNVAAPTTYGINIATPKFGGFGFGFTAAMTSNNADNTNKYDGSLFRFKVVGKLGPGALTAWYDLAQRTDKLSSGDQKTNYGYVYLAYTYTLFKSKTSKVIMMPRVRVISETNDVNKDFNRKKIECLFIASFK